MLRTFSDNPTCRHIVFGGCHDAGYLLNLEQFKHNELKASRITLLETTPAYRGFQDLAHFKHARFDTVFKTEPLPEARSSGFNPLSNGFTPAASAPPPTQAPILSRTTTNQSDRASMTSPAPNTASPTSTAPDINGDASWGK